MYGDGYGMFCDAFFVQHNKSYILNKNIIDEIVPNRAVGLIPCEINNYITKHNISVYNIRKSALITLYSKSLNNNQGLLNYFNELVLEYSNNYKCLYIESCVYEAGIMKFDEYINFNIEIIQKYIPKRSLIIVKKHPRQNFSYSKFYKEKLGTDYEFLEFPDEFNKLPVEIMGEILSNFKYIVAYGSVVITLKYLYNIDVVDLMEMQTNFFLISVLTETKKKLNTYCGNGLLCNYPVKTGKVISGEKILFFKIKDLLKGVVIKIRKFHFLH